MLLEKQNQVSVVGGDQGTESLAAVIEKSLRRMGLLLAALWLSQHPGMDSMLQAVKMHT